MGSPSAVLNRLRIPEPTPRAGYLLRQGILLLLAVKDSDIRILTLEQCRDAVDKGLHAGGAFSATIPLVALYYGGYFDRALLKNSRSYESILNGHPGPVLPGVHLATGPMGQGFSVAQGFAI